MESEQQESIDQDVDKSAEILDIVCLKCKQAFSVERPAKLLPCLHTFCDQCLTTHSRSKTKAVEKKNNEKVADGEGQPVEVEQEPDAPVEEVTSSSHDDGKLHCPECQAVYTEEEVTINPFVSTSNVVDGGSVAAGGLPKCTSCDDDQDATSFCVQCDEWLCDPCVVAHKRVKLTKEHNVTNRSGEGKNGDTGPAVDSKPKQVMYCNTHKQEQLKLFCLTCEALTCRDCQLNAHKDHKYEYVEDTIAQQKKVLLDGVQVLKTRLAEHSEMSEKIINKEKDIKSQQVEVFTEVRKVADMITNELISWCKQLLNFLQGVCKGRMKDLTFKRKEVETYSTQAKHTIEFVESALQSGDDLSLLFTKSFMSKNIKQLTDQDINFQKTLLDLNIKYENNAKFLTQNVSKMGFINVNGKSYPQDQSTTPAATPTQDPLADLNKDNFSQGIANLLNRQPVHVRDMYKSLELDKKKQFLQTLMQQSSNSLRKQQQQQLINQQQQQLGQQNQSSPSTNFSSDSNAIRDLYRGKATGGQPQQHTARTGQTFVPEIPFQQKQHLIQHQQQQQQQIMHQRQQQQLQRQRQQQQQMDLMSGGQQSGSMRPAPPQQPNFQNWRGVGNSAPAFNAPRPPATATSNSMIPASQFLDGKIPMIDPLNLRGGSADPVRVKQEPREKDYPALQAAVKPLPATGIPLSPAVTPPQHNPTIMAIASQPPVPPLIRSMTPTTTVMSPTSSNRNSPGHTPSPSHSDSLVSRSTVSPAMPDINIMDTDRNQLLSGLVHPSGHKVSAYLLHPKHDPNDPSEDYCGVCHNGGDLLCCDRCPKVFHLQCHVPTISNMQSTSQMWTCTMCIPDQELIIHTRILRECEVTSTGKRKAPNGMVDKEIRTCERILLELFCLQNSTLFHEPVPKSVPNYHKIISRPMDFGTIKCKLRSGHFAHYDTVEDFIADVMLVFKNCSMYNTPMSDVYMVGQSVKSFFESLVEHFLPCYTECLTHRIPTPPPASFQGDGDSNSLDGQGKPKRRRSPAPDSTRDNSSPDL